MNLVKHAPPRLVSQVNTNTIFISASSPPLAIVNKIKKHFLKHKKSTRVVAKGMGKAIEKTAIVATILQSQNYKVNIRTGTVTVNDELDDNINEPVVQQRSVSYLELTVYAK